MVNKKATIFNTEIVPIYGQIIKPPLIGGRMDHPRNPKIAECQNGDTGTTSQLTDRACRRYCIRMLTESQLLKRAAMPKPKRSSAKYHLWRKSRIKLGLPTNLCQHKTLNRKLYMREYMRKYRMASGE